MYVCVRERVMAAPEDVVDAKAKLTNRLLPQQVAIGDGLPAPRLQPSLRQLLTIRCSRIVRLLRNIAPAVYYIANIQEYWLSTASLQISIILIISSVFSSLWETMVGHRWVMALMLF